MSNKGVLRVNGGGVFEINPAAADVAFDAAIAALGDEGGVVDIHQGDAEFDFANPVTITKPNVKIRGNGSTLSFVDSSSLYMFRIRAQGFSISGTRFRDIATAGLGDNTRRIISFEDNGTDNASGNGRITDCDFDVTLATETVRDYQCISAVGNSAGGATLRRGLDISGCSFYARVNSMPRTRYVTSTTTPYGITFIKTRKSGAQFIRHNRFLGEFAASTLSDGTGDPLDTLQINTPGFTIGDTTITIKSSGGTLTGIVQPKSTFTIAGNAQIYTITKQATASSNLVSVNFFPALVANAATDASVTMTATSAPAHVASAISMTDHDRTVVSENSFDLLHTQAATIVDDVGGGALIHSISNEGESGHSGFYNNQLHELDVWYALRCEGGSSFSDGWIKIHGNDFGRIFPRCQDVISLDKCLSVSIQSNGFHNLGGGNHGSTPTLGRPIYAANGCKSIVVAGNIYDIASVGEKLFHHDGTTKMLHYYGNSTEWTIA